MVATLVNLPFIMQVDGADITRYLRGQWPLEPVASVYELWAPARRGMLLRANQAHWRRSIDGWDPFFFFEFF